MFDPRDLILSLIPDHLILDMRAIMTQRETDIFAHLGPTHLNFPTMRTLGVSLCRLMIRTDFVQSLLQVVNDV